MGACLAWNTLADAETQVVACATRGGKGTKMSVQAPIWEQSIFIIMMHSLTALGYLAVLRCRHDEAGCFKLDENGSHFGGSLAGGRRFGKLQARRMRLPWRACRPSS